MKMGFGTALVYSYPNICSETPNYHQNLDMIAFKKNQGINPTGLIPPLENSSTITCYEKPNFHQNLEIIALKKMQGINPTDLSTLLADS